MKTFSKIIYVILTAYLTAVITMKLKASLFTYANGWDGIAAMLGALMIGLLLGIIGGIYSLKWIPDSKMKASILLVALLSFAATLLVYFGAKKRNVKSMRIEKVSSYPRSMGIFKVPFENNKVVNFVNPMFFDSTGNRALVDSVVINQNATDFSYAPSWFLPYYMKPDYQVLEFEVVSLQKQVVEVIGNRTNGNTYYILLKDGIYMDWSSHLLSGASIDFIDPVSLLFYERPLEHSSLVKAEGIKTAKAVSVKGEWLQLYLEFENTTLNRMLWCKWFDSSGKIMVRVNYFT